MIGKTLIRFSVAALVLICIGISGCSEGSDRIFTPPVEETSDQLSTGLQTDYVDGNPGDGTFPPIYGDSSEDQLDYDAWIDKYGEGTDAGSGGGSTKPQDFENRKEE
ncbi:MAG: hypothetical protein GY867_03655 [bacterium]|nr:hypothetical protein [bacterium]